jgi:radical SAM protein with 4Fe4S-binding SPASM domain
LEGQVISAGRLEITTVIGCKMNCLYCPQRLFIGRYCAEKRPLQMSLETFKSCIDKVPEAVRIDFSGMSEPWQNGNCAKMMRYAADTGHAISMYSTLVGMTDRDFELIKDIPFDNFTIHFPDAQQNSKIPIGPDYVGMLKRVLDHFQGESMLNRVGGSCHGGLHDEIKALIPQDLYSDMTSFGINFRMIDRAGQLEMEELSHHFQKGKIKCNLCNRQLNHNVLLPDGSVLLCCMDYGMEYVLGNLLTGCYTDLFTNGVHREIVQLMDNEESELICRRCHHVGAWTSTCKMLPVENVKESVQSPLKFAAYLAERHGKAHVAVQSPNETISFSLKEARESVIFVPDIIPYMQIPAALEGLRRGMEESPSAVILAHGLPPEGAGQVEGILTSAGIRIDFCGTIGKGQEINDWLFLLSNSKAPLLEDAPSDFKVLAIVSSYNEVDVIESVISDLIRQGVDVYLVDNWSDDGTFEAAEQFLGKGLAAMERFPEAGPTPTYNWTEILQRKETVSRSFDANWYIAVDGDELRESPWPGVKLRDALYIVDRSGFNCIDHTVIDFRPIDNRFEAGDDLRRTFQFFEFGTRTGHFIQIKGWKKTIHSVGLAASGGHAVQFPDARIYPYKFLLRHYPLRSQEQGYKKVVLERKPRWNSAERANGWHTHYDNYHEMEQFLWDKVSLTCFDNNFHREYLMERLSGVGIDDWALQRDTELAALKLISRLDESKKSTEALFAAFSDPHDVLTGLENDLLKNYRDSAIQCGNASLANTLCNLLSISETTRRSAASSTNCGSTNTI